ncbi:addiction module antidote protein, HigA family [Mariprofundus ferrinatatus]|uniref:Addiction module antidote protein, HigA family n=2 Tax=Mariprofundus ferrinatatus TaxID=1921087 RepID=A0A2K8L351_9PROT|nr:addiction module antidote protein, HigA family [Mariprofundus ferrinatatus]
MSINMDELNNIDYSDVATGENLNPVSPGDILLHDFMEPLSLSSNALARAMKVPTNRITGILNGTRNITADTALRLQAAFGVSASFWMGLQSRYNLEIAEAELAETIAAEVHRFAA